MPLDLLPSEILDQITSTLANGDLAHLMACNRRLALRVERQLYGSKTAQNRGMFWACRLGLVGLIRRLVLHYAVPVSTVTVHWRRIWLGGWDSNDIRYFNGSATVLTLYIAATRGRIEAFNVLLELGARVDVLGLAPWNHAQLMRRICSPTSDWALLRIFFKRKLDDQIRPTHHPSFTLPLLWVIGAKGQADPPLEIVQMLLHRGAGTFVNERYETSHHGFVTPFTAAIRQRDYDPITLLDLLLGAGGLIHGPSFGDPVAVPTHVPVFAAAEAMATRGGRKVMDWCLQHGADINHHVPVQDKANWGEDYYYATPALFYIASINSWDSNQEDETLRDPAQGLSYFIKQGAHIDPAPDDPDQKTRGGRMEVLPYTHVNPPWCLEYLLRKWGMAKMQKKPTYCRTVEFLLRHSVQRGTTAEILARCEYALQSRKVNKYPLTSPYDRQPEETVKIWVDLVRELLLQECRLNPTHLLAEYIVCKGRRLDPLQEMGRAMIDLLLAAGADINARVASDTSLHKLCRAYNARERGGPAWGNQSIFTWVYRPDNSAFLAYLLSRGADASLTTAEGRTPKDLLLEKVDPRGNLEKVANLLP